MKRQLKVYLFPYRRLGAVLRGDARALNLPADAQILGHHDVEPIRSRTGVALLVHSLAFEEAPLGIPLPVVTAVFAKEKNQCASTL